MSDICTWTVNSKLSETTAEQKYTSVQGFTNIQWKNKLDKVGMSVTANINLCYYSVLTWVDESYYNTVQTL